MEEKAPRQKYGGRQKGTPNVLPDLRAMTLQALMKAGGVAYLVRMAEMEPHAFMNLLGKVMPRELHAEVSGELRIRQEVRRDLVDKVIVLMRVPESTEQDAANEASPTPLPAITHNPDTMLKAQRSAPRESLSRATENARLEGSAITSGILQRATAMHLERSQCFEPQGYIEQAAHRIERSGDRSQRDAEREAEDAGKPCISPRAGARAIPPGTT